MDETPSPMPTVQLRLDVQLLRCAKEIAGVKSILRTPQRRRRSDHGQRDAQSEGIANAA